ncbi:MAG: hypothetical protein P8N25_00725 [Alphaproteobacteria bacterium]|nr:hypothetical protein [Alphaproteobacteria bacterium]
MDNMDNVFTTVAIQIVIMAITYLVFKRYIEKYKYNRSISLNKNNLFNEKKILVCEGIWERIVDLEIELSGFLCPCKSIPNFKELSDEKIRKTLKSDNFSAKDTEYLLKSNDKEKVYSDHKYVEELNSIMNKLHDFISFYNKKKIFLLPTYKNKISKLITSTADITASLQDKSTIKNRDNDITQKKCKEDIKLSKLEIKELEKSIKVLIKEIEEITQQKLFPSH